MGGSALPKRSAEFITVQDYLEGEIESEERHEYVDGEVYAMAGGSEPHEIVALNLAANLLMHMRGRGCRVFKGDMKVRLKLNQKDLFYYPDIMVVCEPKDEEPAYKQSPSVIIEVMSDYKRDHVEKLFAYQQIPSLEEYIIIDQNSKKQDAWVYRRESIWAQESPIIDEQLIIPTLDFKTNLSDLYQMG